jgi:hypothetical protein
LGIPTYLNRFKELPEVTLTKSATSRSFLATDSLNNLKEESWTVAYRLREELQQYSLLVSVGKNTKLF